jgi:hypothetical protein
MSSRQSLGGLALRDSSSRLNARSRRQSLGGAGLAKESPSQDRRALLDDWRRQVKNEEANIGSSGHKRDRENAPEIGVTAPLGNQEGSTALERYRMRKQQKLLQQHAEESNSGSRPPLLPPARSLVSGYDDDETGDFSRAVGTIGISGGTPSFSRRLASSGKATRRKSLSVSALHRHARESLSQESREPDCKLHRL